MNKYAFRVQFKARIDPDIDRPHHPKSESIRITESGSTIVVATSFGEAQAKVLAYGLVVDDITEIDNLGPITE